MSLSIRFSVALGPLFIALVTREALAAGTLAAAPAAGPAVPSAAPSAKRTAKRAPPLARPSAPTATEALPPLPASAPPHAPLVSTTTTTSAAPIVGGEPDSVPPKAEAPGARVSHEVSPDGLVSSIGTGLIVPANAFVEGGAPLGAGVALEGRAGYYVTKHIGFVGGFRGSFAHKVSGCAADSCKGYSLQVPLMVQLAATRARGAYGEAGVGLFTKYAMSAGDVSAKVSSPVELKLGGGYRIGGSGSSLLDRALAADLNLGVDIGRMTGADVQVGSRSASASIDHPTIHVVVAFGVRGHFAL